MGTEKRNEKYLKLLSSFDSWALFQQWCNPSCYGVAACVTFFLVMQVTDSTSLLLPYNLFSITAVLSNMVGYHYINLYIVPVLSTMVGYHSVKLFLICLTFLLKKCSLKKTKTKTKSNLKIIAGSCKPLSFVNGAINIFLQSAVNLNLTPPALWKDSH